MGQALYRKYRSRSLEEVVGQEHITETLAKAIKSGRISHAYLFTGPRGVGKTSIARILAHEVNGLPYDDQQAHIDIIEIDAASNRRIDEIRELRDKIHVAPAIAKYKVYVIDEVHMLTREAFNALLKTLEEPPAHAIFILATTEAHKLPETIVSRTQRYIFRPIEPAKAIDHLRSIAKQEKITITDEALELVVEHGSGSFRDSISLLDQLANTGAKIDLSLVQQTLGVAPAQAISDLLAAIRTEQSDASAYIQLAALLDKGYQPANIAKQLAALLRKELTSGGAATANDIALLSSLLEVPLSHDPEALLEVSLLHYNASAAPISQVLPVAPVPVTNSVSATETEKIASVPSSQPVEPINTAPQKFSATPPSSPVPATPALQTLATAPLEANAGTTEPAEQKPAVQPAVDGALNPESWQQILDVLKKNFNTLYGIVRMAQPDFSQPNALHLSFNFAFHQKRANEARNRNAIADAVTAVVGSGIEITCTYDSEAKAAQPVLSSATAKTTTGTAGSPLSSINNIFGGVEMVE